MDSLIMEGGVALKGTVRVSGAKNAALPILFGAILFDDTVRYTNVPHLRDIHTTAKLLRTLGFRVDFENGNMDVCLDGNLSEEAPYDLVKTMRASVLCLGPLLARLGEASVAMPGGCAIGARPVDLHLSALEKMGAEFTLDGGYVKGRCKKLHGAHIQFDFPTVGGTENILMAACLADGETILDNAAREPEITDLANFLNSCGAKIEGAGQTSIKIQGVTSLKSTQPYAIMPDRIEAGTYLIAAGMTNGEIRVENCPYHDMEALCAKLEEAGLSFSYEEITDNNGLYLDKNAQANEQNTRDLSYENNIDMLHGYEKNLAKHLAKNLAENLNEKSTCVHCAKDLPNTQNTQNTKTRKQGCIQVVTAKRKSEFLQSVDISTRPHPGFPTDMQAQMMAMLSLASGSSVVEETIFENRFMHVPELIRMGADIRLSSKTAMVRGVPALTGAPVMASDLRAAAGLVLAGLCADGKTSVERVYHLDRGYEGMELKLQELGARIKRVQNG